MTKEEIDALEAGRPLDKLVAERVMEWRKISHLYCGYPPSGPRDGIEEAEYSWPARLGTTLVPNYSTDIAASFLVVEKFRRGHNAPGRDAVACVIKMTVCDGVEVEDCLCQIYSPCMAEVWATAREMPLAIARAALKAVMLS